MSTFQTISWTEPLCYMITVGSSGTVVHDPAQGVILCLQHSPEADDQSLEGQKSRSEGTHNTQLVLLSIASTVEYSSIYTWCTVETGLLAHAYWGQQQSSMRLIQECAIMQ